MIKVTSPYIFIDGQFKENIILTLTSEGEIKHIEQNKSIDLSEIKLVYNPIVPGFINTHCHLELSHMKGKVDTGTTLLPFIESVVKFRDFPSEVIFDAIKLADQEMYDNGIVAVGDISNKADTVETKSKSKISYYTFVEYFDLMSEEMTANTISMYDSVFDAHEHNDKNKKSKVPHAPYSVTPQLFKHLNRENQEPSTISIHNEETQAEIDLFMNKSGGFFDLYHKFNVNLDGFNPINKSSIHYALQHMDNKHKTIFVHNTLSNEESVIKANQWNNQVYWATCPNANLYIENKLPNYKLFIDNNQKVTIGTDSLTSNWQLSIWEEIKTIRKYCSYIPLELLIKWATKNGAEALGFEDRFGEIKVGMKPGLVSIPVLKQGDTWVIVDGKESRVV